MHTLENVDAYCSPTRSDAPGGSYETVRETPANIHNEFPCGSQGSQKGERIIAVLWLYSAGEARVTTSTVGQFP